jgi:uncharacterized lipoprotein YbaY
MSLVSAVISGLAIFSDAAPEVSGAVARILVEEVSRADAPASLVAQMEIPGPILRPEQGALPFSLRVEGIDPQKHYAVRIHIDVDRDGQVSRGDHISTESHPVVTYGAPTHVQVRVRRI